MNRFVDLLNQASALPISEQTAFLRQKAAQMLQANGFKFLTLEETTPEPSSQMRIGIAPYSHADLELLDELAEEAVHGRLLPRINIDIFDVLSCQRMSDFDRYIPGITPVYQTPVVGIWENEVLAKSASGARARQLIQNQLISTTEKVG